MRAGVRRAVWVFLLAAALSAYTHTGLVSCSGRPLPGATVRALQGTLKEVTTTGEDGIYILELGAPGAWTVEVEMFGFSGARKEIEDASRPTALDWDLALKPRTPAASAPAGDGFQTVALNQVEDPAETEAVPPEALPHSGENAAEAFLINGSISQGLETPPPPDPAEERTREWAERARQALAGVPSAAPPPGAAAKKAVNRAGRPKAGAKAGSKAGGRRADASFGNKRKKSRGALRGSAYYSFRNSALDARPYSLTGQTVARPAYAWNRLGFSLGGPLKLGPLIQSDRTFLFLNYAGTRSRNPFGATGTLPTPAERAGDFAESVTRLPMTLYDRTSGLPFPGNRLPASLLNLAALRLLEFMPLPNQPGGLQNYQFLTPVRQNTDNLSLRLNQPLSRKNRLTAGFGWQTRSNEHRYLYGWSAPTGGRGIQANMSWTFNFRKGMVHSLRWNFTRNRSETTPYFAYQRNVAAEIGIQGTAQDPINYGPPNLSFTNFSGLQDAAPLLRRDQDSGLTESLTLVRGKHSFSFGGEYKRSQLNSRTDQNARGSYSFSGLMTSGLDAKGNPLAGTGFDFADFLLGYPQSSSLRFGSANTYFRQTLSAGFVQDDWRARRNLSFSLGLRYEYFSPFREKFGRMANLDVAPGFTGVAVVTPSAGAGPYSGAFPAALIDPDRNNFSPRLGLAWKPLKGRQMSVRAGYGWYYNGSIYNQFASRLASQPPFANTSNQSTSAAHPLTIQTGFLSMPAVKITNSYAIDRFYRIGYAQSWNFSVQKELPHALVAEIGYLGTKGTRLDIQRQPNRAAPGNPLTAEQRRQIGNAVGFTFESSEGSSIYHAGQFRLTRRFRQGMSFNSMYTWSKSIDNASTFGGGGNVVAQNDQDLRAERGLSSFDQRHLLSLNCVLNSPIGDGAAFFRPNGWWGRAFKDWSFSGGLTLRGGTPLTARVLGNRSDSGGTGVVGSGRADATGLPVEGGRFFNLGAFAIPPAGRYGNAGRNTVPGPAFLGANLALGRSFKLSGENRRLDVRLESNNVANHPAFTNLGTVINSLTYGLPTAVSPMRTVMGTIRFRF
ncbi:MAG: TonB-dependent receptor [Acidobacteria bacterium]|nr:TonB-dependent receptor [Acidobacteriota bacterium]